MASADDSVPPTKPMYQYEEALRQHIARVTCVRPFNELQESEQALYKSGDAQTYAVEMHESIFYAQGGGQPFDTGSISSQISDTSQEKHSRVEVKAVRSAAGGRILHFTSSDGLPFAVGDMVRQEVDAARRDYNSRLHSAGHLIGSAVLAVASREPDLAGVIDGPKAQHYPDASYVEFKGLIDGKFQAAIQAQAARFVQDALPVKLFWCKPDELEANGVIAIEGMPVLTGFDGKVRVVDIVGAGAYACGGTHVPDTSYIGSIEVTRIKRQKGISKVSYAIKGKP